MQVKEGVGWRMDGRKERKERERHREMERMNICMSEEEKWKEGKHDYKRN